LIFLVSNFVVLIKEAYGFGSWKMIRILTDPDPQHWNREDEQREEEERNKREEKKEGRREQGKGRLIGYQ
jgi:hypothetical protein